MFNGFTDDTVQFFLDLKFHNNTAYFHDHHDLYVRHVQAPFYAMIEELGPEMQKIDPQMEIRPYKCLSRIHRDTRFSRDKSPYRDHHWFLFRRAGEPREQSLFYYFEFGPDRLGWGMGIWGENRELMDCFRRRMTARPGEFLSLFEKMDLAGHRLFLGGTVHKRMAVPEEIPDGLKRLYLSREMYFGKDLPDFRLAFSRRILNAVLRDFNALSPLYSLLRGYMDQMTEPIS